MTGSDAASEDARAVLDAFIFVHRATAIPAMIGACVLWAVENGGGDLVRSSLENAIRLSREMDAIRSRAAQ